MQQCEDAGITPHIAKTRQGTTPLPKGQVTAPVKRMVARMATVAAKATYGKRKATVETVFGTLKQTMGLRQFHLRGLAGVSIEWDLACMAPFAGDIHG